MIKSENNNKYYSLSRREAALLQAVEGKLVFSPETARRLTGWKAFQVSNCLTALQKKKKITQLKRNTYVITATISEHLLSIAREATFPSYVSFWTACSYYGLTEQQVQTIQVVSPKQYPSFTISNHRVEITTIQPKRWFGYQRIGNLQIAEPEKLLIECLSQPEKCGGIGEVKKCLAAAWPKLNQEVFWSYLCRFAKKSVTARFGYLLEELHLQNTYQKKMLRMIPQGYTLLTPEKKTIIRYDHTWRIIVNDQ